MAQQNILHIVLAIIHKEGEVLLIKRARQDELVPELTWAFPGGKVRPEENIHQSLIREVKEEIGIDIEIERHLGARNYPTKPVVLQDYYLCRPRDSEPLITPEPEEVAEIRWVKAAEARSYFTSDIAPQVLEILAEIAGETTSKFKKEIIN